MCSFVPFLIILRPSTLIGTAVILRLHIFSISIYRSLYLLILSYSLTGMLVLKYQLEGTFFFYSPLYLVVLFFSFLSVWIAISQRTVTILVSVIGSGWYL